MKVNVLLHVHQLVHQHLLLGHPLYDLHGLHPLDLLYLQVNNAVLLEMDVGLGTLVHLCMIISLLLQTKMLVVKNVKREMKREMKQQNKPSTVCAIS